MPEPLPLLARYPSALVPMDAALVTGRLQSPSTATDFVSDFGDFTAATRDAQATLDRYSQSFRRAYPWDATGRELRDAAILVTGTTGALGAHLLALFLASNDVTTVYAFNRPHARHALPARQQMVFNEQGLDPSLLSSEKIVLLEGDTTQGDLGLSNAVYDELRRNVTHIVINAWPVKFTQPLAEFEPSIKGVRHLVDLALSPTARVSPLVQCISSTAVSRNAAPRPGILAPEEPILDAGRVVGLGYAEAKWVVERMLQIASAQTGLRTLSVRVGQLSGAKSGFCDKESWVSVIVRSAARLGGLPDSSHHAATCSAPLNRQADGRANSAPHALPTLIHEIQWVRVVDGAVVLFELLSAPQTPAVLHLVHPWPTPWRVVFRPYAKALGVPLLPFSEWMRRVVLHRDVIAARLLVFWRLLGERGFDAFARFEDIDIRKALALSPMLRSMQPIEAQEIDSWFEYWRRIGVLPSSPARL